MLISSFGYEENNQEIVSEFVALSPEQQCEWQVEIIVEKKKKNMLLAVSVVVICKMKTSGVILSSRFPTVWQGWLITSEFGLLRLASHSRNGGM